LQIGKKIKNTNNMKKYLLTVLSVVFSITLMGQTFDDPNLNLRYTVISTGISTGKVEVRLKDQNGTNTNIVIPDSVTNGSNTYAVTKIANNGFHQVNGLQKVTIPNTVTTIGDNAFSNNGSLTVVNMGNNVESIGNNAFQSCHALKTFYIPSTCTSIGNYAFANCGALEGMHIPNPGCSLGTYVFQNCHNLSFINLPANLTTIPEGLLENCDSKLRSIVIPENVTLIESKAFGQTHSANIIFLGCGVEESKEITVKSDAFANSHDDFIEFFCTDATTDAGANAPRSVRLNIVNVNQWNTVTPSTLFGNNLEGFQVPCGMEAHYAMSIYGNASQTSNINEGISCIAVSQQHGNFCDPATWRGYNNWTSRSTYESAANKETWLATNGYPNFMPRDPMDPFIINHTVTLKHRRDIYAFTSVNNGILVIDATGGDKDGQLVERDSAYFDNNTTLYVEYTMDGNNIVKSYPITTTTDITSLLDNSIYIGETKDEYKTEHIFNNNDSIYIRDTKTRYLLSLKKSNGVYVFSRVADRDYYRIDNGVIYYYGEANPVSAVINNLTGNPNDNNGFFEESEDYICHKIQYGQNNANTTYAHIDLSGNVTLRGTDYTYGHVRMQQNLSGEIHVKVPAEERKWNFVGAPFNVYDLYAVKLYNNLDASAVRFDYEENDWETVLSYGEDIVRPGEGFLAWPFYAGGITFSTKRDYGMDGGLNRNIDFVLNNDTVYVEKNIADNYNKWMALANPYPAKLCVNSFVSDNTDIIDNTNIQGQGVYILNAASSSWSFMDSDDNYDLGVGQGFFVNVKNSGTNKIMFTKTQIHGYEEPQCEHGVNHSAKSSSQRGFIRLSMIADNVASELLFAHNEDAQQYYDIYDANKLFAMERMTEPYFVTDGIKLVKEEVKELPYYATMNVRSYEEKEVKFRADYIPEGYAVSIIDGEETIDLTPGVEYTTEVSVGENANRFKVLVKKSVGLNDVEELAIDITNSNRIVNISTNETNLQIEVYNALGQKVLSTHSLNFSLNEVSAGAYMIKAFNSKGSKTQKIIIK
jgi:hypothetical protein